MEILQPYTKPLMWSISKCEKKSIVFVPSSFDMHQHQQVYKYPDEFIWMFDYLALKLDGWHDQYQELIYASTYTCIPGVFIFIHGW